MSSRLACTAALVAATAALVGSAGCWAKDPCGAGYFIGDDYQCYPLPTIAPGTSAPDAGDASTDAAADAASDAAAPVTRFGAACSEQSECSGDAPICAAPQLPYCTQIQCNAGEANAGACPDGFVCVSSAQGSACLKM